MSTRLQVIFDDAEMAELQAAAASEGLNLSDWVRRALRDARRLRSGSPADARIAAIREAARYSFPTGDIETMNAQIDAGRENRTYE